MATPIEVLKGTYRWNNTLTRIPIDNPIGLDFESTIVDGETTTTFTFNRLQNSGNYIQFYVTKVNNSTEDSRVDTFINVYNLSTNTWEWELQDFTVIYPMTYDETLGNWFNSNATAISVEPEPDEPEPEEPDTPTESATIKAGTYKWNDVLSLPSFATDTNVDYDFPFPSSGVSNVQGIQITATFDTIRFYYEEYEYAWGMLFKLTSYSPTIPNGPTIGNFQPWYNFNDNIYYSQIYGDGMQDFTVTEDITFTDTNGIAFVNWFNVSTNGEETPETPETPDTPTETPTVDSIKAKIQNLINKANTTTGKSDTDLTSGVNSLIAGYGQGGGSTDCDGCIIEVDTLPTENIDENALYKMGESYYKPLVGFKDVIIVSDGVAQTLTGSIPNAEFYHVVTKPTENIVETNLADIWAMYYVEDENDIFFYADIGNGAEWHSLSLMMGSSFQGVITDVSEATTDGYYATIGGWEKYLAPSGNVTIVANGTVDVSKYERATVNIASVYTVQTVAELPTDAPNGSLAFVLGGA